MPSRWLRTIRAVLQNKAYIGEFSFKKKQWVKVPDTNVRRYRWRPESEVMRRSQPELRIIDEETWEAVQTRIAAVRAFYRRRRTDNPRAARSPASPRATRSAGSCVVPSAAPS
jgi:hypothetical protein